MDCEKLIDCHQPALVAHCHDDGICYTGNVDARCTDQPNADQPGSPELGDGGWCWDGRRDQHCVGELSPPPPPSPSPYVSSFSPTTSTTAMHETIKAGGPRGEDEGHFRRHPPRRPGQKVERAHFCPANMWLACML